MIATWFRLDLGRRWRSLLVLTLLVAFASGTVMAAVAGARRGATALDRLLAVTSPATVMVLPNTPGFDWDAVRALPEVEAMTTFVVSSFSIEGLPAQDNDNNGFPPADAELWHTIERPVVLAGRLPDPTKPDEVVVTPRFLASHGMEVGDTLTLRLYTPAEAENQLEDGTSYDGPAVTATIVGVVRSLWTLDDSTSGRGGVMPSPGLFATYPDSFLGTSGSTGYVNALIRLRGGEASIAPFEADLAQVTGRDNIQVESQAPAFAEKGHELLGFEAKALLAFALAAAIAALFIVGQAIVRHASTTVDELQPLRAVGMSPAQTRWAATIGPALAGLAGAAVGAIAAVIASRWFPIGTASLVEPNPGTSVDLVVLGIGLVVVAGLAAAAAAITATTALRADLTSRVPRRSAVATRVANAGLPVPTVLGTRFALEPGTGRSSVPVRPALIGAVIGVLGVLAALTFARGVNDASNNLGRFGMTYQAAGFFGLGDMDFVPPDDMLTLLDSDPDITVVNDTRTDVGQANGVSISVMTLDPVSAPLDVVLLDGRAPDSPDEIALAPRTAAATGLAVGDTIDLGGSRGQRRLTVTGVAFVFASPHNDYATGAWVTRPTYDELFDGFKFHFALVGLRPGADLDAVNARIESETQAGEPFLFPPWPPTEIAQLQQVAAMPMFLGVFLVILALGAIAHALATAVQRRRHELAVLRAVGMTRRQSRGVVATQATVLALIGVVVGAPLGVALGRTVWRYVADWTPLYYSPPTAWLALLLAVPVAMLTSNLLAVWPSRRAATMPVAHVLRAE